jgi:hypothetical protein
VSSEPDLGHARRGIGAILACARKYLRKARTGGFFHQLGAARGATDFGVVRSALWRAGIEEGHRSADPWFYALPSARRCFSASLALGIPKPTSPKTVTAGMLRAANRARALAPLPETAAQ